MWARARRSAHGCCRTSVFPCPSLVIRPIRAHLPTYNIKAARPLDKWWVITVAGGPAPRLRIQNASAAARGKQAAHVIGPFASRRPLVEALRVLNDALGLRDCTDRVPMVLHDAVDLFDDMVHPSLARTPGCHRYETRRCLGPCVGATTEYAYRAQLSRARASQMGSSSIAAFASHPGVLTSSCHTGLPFWPNTKVRLKLITDVGDSTLKAV